MPFILAIDFDGTLFKTDSLEIKEAKRDIIDKVKEFKKAGAEIVLWTCREGTSLEDAVKVCKEGGLEFDAINENAPSWAEYQKEKSKEGDIFATRKIFANFYLDDRACNLEFFLQIDARATCEKHK